MPGPVLVTGAAGFVGSHLLRRLSADGAEVVAWRRPSPTPPPSSPRGVRWMDVDLLERDRVHAAVAGVRPSQVYHCAGAAHVAQSWSNTHDTYALNVLATHHLLGAIRASALDARLLVTGSATVYRSSGEVLTEGSPIGPASPYATSKLAQELVARHAAGYDGQAVLVSRSFNHIGPGQDPSYVAASIARQVALIEAGQHAPEIAVGNLEARRDLMDVRDTVHAYLAMMARARPGVPYNVCSGRAVSIRALLDGLVARSRVPVRVVQDPSRLRPNDVPLMVGSFARLQAETGWYPVFTIDETLDHLLDDWRARVRA
jgi:GDP-4-dehydro-6-deoxy-D-mannose reductase